MALLKVAEYRLSQDQTTGLLLFKLFNDNGTLTNWVGGKWHAIPFVQFPSLVGILTTNAAFYDTVKGMFIVGSTSGSGAAPVANSDAFRIGEAEFEETEPIQGPVGGV